MSGIKIGDNVLVNDKGIPGNFGGMGEVMHFDSLKWPVVRPIVSTSQEEWRHPFPFHPERVKPAPPLWAPTAQSDPTMKPTNPKDIVGSDKLPLHLWPETATAMGSLAFLEGALKYGRNNWRDAGVRATIYIDALRRHINAWAEGEDVAADSGIPHLGHALACLAILVDAEAAGKLIDDRQFPGGYNELVSVLTPHIKRLKERHADRTPPKHWTIQDA